MSQGRSKIFNEMLKPRVVRLWLGLVAFVGTYDVFSNQFELWPLKKLIGMSGALMPPWGWMMLFMAGLFYALFEYVRLTVPVGHVPRVAPTLAQSAPQPDWAIWKARGNYAIYEFARILDKRDPAGTGTSAGTEGYQRLLLEDVEEGKLKHIPERVMGFEGYYIRDIDTLTKIKRDVALAWARDHEFDVSHVA